MSVIEEENEEIDNFEDSEEDDTAAEAYYIADSATDSEYEVDNNAVGIVTVEEAQKRRREPGTEEHQQLVKRLSQGAKNGAPNYAERMR